MFGSSANLVFDIFARDNASSTFDRVGHSAGSAANGGLSKLGTRLKSVAKVAGLAVAAGALFAAKWGYDAVKAASKDQQAQALLETAIRNNTDARKKDIAGLESWITKMGKAYGVADDDLRPALSRLVTATKDVGQAQKLAGLAMDVSAGTGKSLESVSMALMKAQNGQVSSLSRLGINTKNAAGETLSLEEITKRLADTYGGAAAAKADTFQGKMDRLKLIMDETKESIGAKLIPVLTDMADWFLNKGLPAAQRLGDWFGKHLGPAFSAVGNIISNHLMPFLAKVGAALAADMPTAVNAAKGAFEDAKPILTLIGKVFSNILGPAILWVAENVIPVVVFQMRLMGKVWGAIGKVATWIWNNLWQPIFHSLVSGIGTVLEMWGKMLHTLAKVPGFGWAEKAADKMDAAAQKANDLAANIKKIPDAKNVQVNVKYNYSGLKDPTRGSGGDPGLPPPTLQRGSTGRFSTDGGGGRFDRRQRSAMTMDPRGVQIKVVGLDAGYKAFLQTGGSNRY